MNRYGNGVRCDSIGGLSAKYRARPCWKLLFLRSGMFRLRRLGSCRCKETKTNGSDTRLQVTVTGIYIYIFYVYLFLHSFFLSFVGVFLDSITIVPAKLSSI